MTGLEILGALGALSACIGVLKPVVDRQDDLQTIAVEKLNEAVTETEGYFYTQNGKAQIEHTLNRVWNSASIALDRAGYPEMSRLAQIKGTYWLNPNNWDDETIRESGIQLSEMRRKLNEALEQN
ncbi:hypothetical protein CZ809_00205 [Photobacterium piscicola]|uniref:Uncharacterized protein n=1 Tax=Photobacterium piscicola TaxID=1378299 RepID=A0A1T5HV71_9GAMM|nr:MULTISPECIES: hypothetical protein [Photobacterium]SKC30728.1 hypothetical protein CZ809_00205 [Photobacterium piscicola]